LHWKCLLVRGSFPLFLNKEKWEKNTKSCTKFRWNSWCFKTLSTLIHKTNSRLAILSSSKLWIFYLVFKAKSFKSSLFHISLSNATEAIRIFLFLFFFFCRGSLTFIFNLNLFFFWSTFIIFHYRLLFLKGFN